MEAEAAGGPESMGVFALGRPEEVRIAIDASIFALETDIEPVSGVEDVSLPHEGHQVSARIYTPEGEGPLPLVVFVHGAAWVAGSLDTHDNVCRRFASRVPAVVVSVDYPLAPESRFPTPVEDAYRTFVWAADNATSIGADPRRLALAGDSAGGNLAAAMCLMARDRSGPKIRFQLLVDPALDFSAYDAEGFEYLRWCREQYLGDANDILNPYASPLQAPSLEQLPPAFIITAELDPLRAEGEAYAERLRQAGVPANVYRQTGKEHLGPHFARASIEAEEAVDLCVAVLKAALKQ